jgi:uncharacterized protein (TIGR02300 family)
LTGGYRYGKARAASGGGKRLPMEKSRFLERPHMVKPEWGIKRTCPKCSTRFYDLGKEDPVHCISCGTEWIPEPVLKSKQPLAFEAAAPVAKEETQDDDLAAEELTVDEDEEVSADEEVDLDTGDNDLGVETAGEDDEV